MTFESANNAAEVLGCDYEELATAVFKHHLKQIIEQVTSGGSRPSPDEDKSPGMGFAPFPFVCNAQRNSAQCLVLDLGQGEGRVFDGKTQYIHLQPVRVSHFIIFIIKNP